ncbi:MAG: ribonuclease Y [Candidatus Melainabacteria bacterium GWF2_32_7]|nr:MAG: ribonuclease Y [Candidatus Melainabacteria bacterium GWF2_32_7]
MEKRYRTIENIGQILIFVALLAAAVIYIVYLHLQLKDKNSQIAIVEAEASRKILEAEEQIKLQRKEALISAKEALHNQRQEFETEVRERRAELAKLEQRLIQKEENLESKNQAAVERENELAKKIDELYDKEDYLAELVDKQTKELERISGITAEEGRTLLLQHVEEDLKKEAAQLIRDNEAYIKETATTKAKEIVSNVMQRCAIDQVVESTVAVVNLPNDEMKGRIIGREGRNIRALETFTGVDLIIDDTPEAVVLSSFDPIRREIARTALEKLITDGRIHPVRIEEMVNKAREELDERMFKEGETATFDLGIMNLHPELIKTLGRLYFRTSYGQNVLKHSIEVGNLAGMLATELGANVNIAKRAGLLHDLGKALDQTQEGTHIELGVEIARRYGENEAIIHAIEAHHDDVTADTVEAVLVKIADAMSAGRPGARRDTLEIYIKRIQKLEEIATSYPGIKKSFAVQAGREIRVMVQPSIFDDVAASKLARDIAKRIETELEYPGQIRVTVVREIRATEIAK